MDKTKNTDIIDFDDKIDDTKNNSGWNIFSELSWELDFWEKIEEFQQEKKWLWDYLKLWSKLIWFFNFFIFFAILVFWLYVFIQKSDNFDNVTYLDPICYLFIDEDKKINNSCSSLTTLNNNYKTLILDLKNKIWAKLTPIVLDLYNNDNFANTIEVKFLNEKTNNRLDVFKILWDFDEMLTEYLKDLDKWNISCQNISINENLELSMNCSSYSWDWGKNIPWRKKTLEGTSVTIAASFLDFIEANPRFWFTLKNKQKTFTLSDFFDPLVKPYATKQTTFSLDLKYTKNLNLSF